jgi:hypothetical protein
VIPPESPNFISIPQPLQEHFHRTFRQKGFVPKPRDVFPRNTDLSQHVPQVIAATTLEPKDQRPDSELTEQQLYKRRTKALRRKLYAEGLSELHERRLYEDSSRESRSNALRAERERLIAQPEREDARLTNVSIPKEMRATKLSFSIDEAREMQDRKVANVAKKENRKLQHQHNALHTLYMNARKFITTEEQLMDKIREEFDDKTFGDSARSASRSVWDSLSVPDGVNVMVDRSTVGRAENKKTLTSMPEAWARDQERMKKLAEGLSGGKM